MIDKKELKIRPESFGVLKDDGTIFTLDKNKDKTLNNIIHEFMQAKADKLKEYHCKIEYYNDDDKNDIMKWSENDCKKVLDKLLSLDKDLYDIGNICPFCIKNSYLKGCTFCVYSINHGDCGEINSIWRQLRKTINVENIWTYEWFNNYRKYNIVASYHNYKIDNDLRSKTIAEIESDSFYNLDNILHKVYKLTGCVIKIKVGDRGVFIYRIYKEGIILYGTDFFGEFKEKLLRLLDGTDFTDKDNLK